GPRRTGGHDQPIAVVGADGGQTLLRRLTVSLRHSAVGLSVPGAGVRLQAGGAEQRFGAQSRRWSAQPQRATPQRRLTGRRPRGGQAARAQAGEAAELHQGATIGRELRYPRVRAGEILAPAVEKPEGAAAIRLRQSAASSPPSSLYSPSTSQR